MKKFILSLVFICCCLFTTSSCITSSYANTIDNELIYSDVYVINSISYPVYWLDNLAYYWFDNRWIMIPSYRYNYIRHMDIPLHLRAHRPRPYHYGYRPYMHNRNFDRRPDYRPNHRPNYRPNYRSNYRPNNGPGYGRPNISNPGNRNNHSSGRFGNAGGNRPSNHSSGHGNGGHGPGRR